MDPDRVPGLLLCLGVGNKAPPVGVTFVWPHQEQDRMQRIVRLKLWSNESSQTEELTRTSLCLHLSQQFSGSRTVAKSSPTYKLPEPLLIRYLPQ